MRRVFLVIFILTLFATACAGSTGEQIPSDTGDALLVTGSTPEKRYTVEDLKSLDAGQASFRDITYVGVPLSTLLRDAGFDPQAVKAVKAVAVDGFSANYDPQLVNRADTLVAYAQAEGPLAEDEGNLRMVLPDQEGKLNVRQLVEIQVKL
jgi:DMSO/TMAO reductase YedYZ molybdopterin-dependent catalytic subunit